MHAVISFILAIVIALALIGFVHAFIAKQITGKWPHQSNRSKRVYDALNNATTSHQADDGHNTRS